jgi:hypothetical protein
MKKLSKNKQLQLNKINISKLNMQTINGVLGGDIPDPTKEFTCDLDTCTTSRTTVDISAQRSVDTKC